MPTGVAETTFDEDPEAEQAALSSGNGSGHSTPGGKIASASKSGTLQRAVEGTHAFHSRLPCLMATSL